MSSFLRVMLKPILRPITRILVGLIAIPLFRLLMRRVIRVQYLDAELEKDLEQWFRASLVLLMATANMEDFIFGFSRPEMTTPLGAFLLGLRLLLAVGVIEMMPDQELFSIIHPGPPKIKIDKSLGFWGHVRKYCWPVTRGLACQHLNRSSPVFAILAAIFQGWVGWFCYGMALVQYLIIGLVTSKDKALDALTEFDRQVAMRRRELIAEFDYLEERVREKGTGTSSEVPESQGLPVSAAESEIAPDDAGENR